MLRRALARRWGAVAGVMRHRPLRRLQLGWAAFFTVDAVSLVGLSVWAFHQHGTAGVGALGVARLLPGALALPLGAWAADRFLRRRVMAVVFGAMAASLLGVAAAMATGAPDIVVYALVVVSSVAASSYRPAHLATVPLVARSAEELVGANVASGTLEGIVTFAGPAAAAVVLAFADEWVVLAAAAAAAAAGLLAVAGVHVGIDPSRTVRRDDVRPFRALVAGFADLHRDRDLAVVVGCFVAQQLVRGALGVVVVALTFDLLDWHGSGVGWLTASMGAGGIVGALLAVLLTGRRALGRPMAAALAWWGLPIAVMGIAPRPAVAVVAMFTIGVANAILDVSGFTVIQRLGADRTLGRVFGVLYTAGIAAGGLAALAVPALVDAMGLRAVLVVVGALLPVLAVACLPRLGRIDRRAAPPDALVGVLSAVDLLADLPPATVEKLATRAETVDLVTDEPAVVQGDSGDRFFVVVDGSLDVVQDGTRRRTLTAGDHFGEVALVRGIPRTATVTARAPTRLLALDGTDFLDALTSSEASYALADERSDELLRDG